MKVHLDAISAKQDPVNIASLSVPNTLFYDTFDIRVVLRMEGEFEEMAGESVTVKAQVDDYEKMLEERDTLEVEVKVCCL